MELFLFDHRRHTQVKNDYEKNKKSREKEGKVSAMRWQDTMKQLYTQPQEEHDALYSWGGQAKRMAATEKLPASNQQGDWNIRPAKAIAKWEMIRTWLRELFLGKGKKEEGGPLKKSKLVNSFNLGEESSQWSWGQRIYWYKRKGKNLSFTISNVNVTQWWTFMG